jgi:hypothetical protein
MKKNLIISPVGDESLHKNWLSENKNFDLVLIYYGKSDDKFYEYKNDCNLIVRDTGEKGSMYVKFISEHLDLIKNYENIWLPDDDLDISTEEINLLFETHQKYSLWLSQPSVKGHVSYDIERKQEGTILRFTTFVEVLCPMMSHNTLLKLYETYGYNKSSWGLDYLWPKLLGYPSNKIAIIDLVTVNHTKPVGGTYDRFERHPMEELKELFAKYQLGFYQNTFSSIKIK